MSITIHQIQSLLSTYQRQQVQSRLAEGRIGLSEGASSSEQDRVLISAEAKRLQVYQKTAEEVLRRMRASMSEGEPEAEDSGADAEGASAPASSSKGP
ncbi:MAG: hypothetical protein ACUVXD_03795 [Thermodesulfobacteriota bacterium]